MILDIVRLIGGLALILYGANWLTDGASAIARRLGVSDLVIGLTIVALGTSTPELVISVLAAVGAMLLWLSVTLSAAISSMFWQSSE